MREGSCNCTWPPCVRYCTDKLFVRCAVCRQCGCWRCWHAPAEFLQRAFPMVSVLTIICPTAWLCVLLLVCAGARRAGPMMLSSNIHRCGQCVLSERRWCVPCAAGCCCEVDACGCRRTLWAQPEHRQAVTLDHRVVPQCVHHRAPPRACNPAGAKAATARACKRLSGGKGAEGALLWRVLCGPARRGLTLLGLSAQVALPTGCVPYSVKNSDSDAKKCPQNCVLSNFTDGTDTGAASAQLCSHVPVSCPSTSVRGCGATRCEFCCMTTH